MDLCPTTTERTKKEEEEEEGAVWSSTLSNILYALLFTLNRALSCLSYIFAETHNHHRLTDTKNQPCSRKPYSAK